MKIYVMSKTEDGEIQTPKVSRDISNLRKEMKAEYDKVLKDAGHLGRGYLLDNGDLVAYQGVYRVENQTPIYIGAYTVDGGKLIEVK